MLDDNLIGQGNQGLSRFANPNDATGAKNPNAAPALFNPGIVDMQGGDNAYQPSIGTGTAVTSMDKSTPSTGGQQNDMAQTNSYLNALNTYADMRKTGIEMEKGPQATTSTLPGLNQATATSLMGGTATPKAPAMASSMRDVNGNLASPAKPQPQNPMIGMMSMMQNFAANNAALPKPPAAASSMRDVNGNLI